jgi:putative hemolysin
MIDLEQTIEARFPQWFRGRREPFARALVRTLLRFAKLPEINAFLARAGHLRGFAFVEAALELVHCRWLVDNVERERIPESGRCVIVSNHPMGALDALALLSFVGSIRRDVKIIANDVLLELEGLAELLIPLRVFGGKPTAESLRAVDAALEAEQAVIVFPSGEVSRLTPLGIRDTPWRRGFLRFAQRAEAPVVPVRIKGRNSALFYGMSAIYKPLGTALLPRELFAAKNRRVEIRVAEPRPVAELLAQTRSQQRALALVRRELYAIGSAQANWQAKLAAIAHAPSARLLLADLKCMRLLGETSDGKQIYAGLLPNDSALMREIARLREQTFRTVGEGTGRALDTDRFDSWYDQIVLWDRDALEVAGAYRVIPCARALAERGPEGLYTMGLFEYHDSLAPVLERGMELGRSFVAPKYWGTRSLDYLWYGIGAYLRAHPDIRYLFGPVSISADLPRPARELLVSYYSRYYGEHLGLARSRLPFNYAAKPPEFGELDAAASLKVLRDNLDTLGARIPTLYKQYTELCEPGGASFLAFGIDPDFGNSIDGLILVDLARIKAKKRERYLGAGALPVLPGTPGEAAAGGGDGVKP